MTTPIGRIRSARRAALRRRYGYAALRILRRGLRLAYRDHRARQVDARRPYSTSTGEITRAYQLSLSRLRRRWPRLDLTDPRAEVDQ